MMPSELQLVQRPWCSSWRLLSGPWRTSARGLEAVKLSKCEMRRERREQDQGACAFRELFRFGPFPIGVRIYAKLHHHRHLERSEPSNDYTCCTA